MKTLNLGILAHVDAGKTSLTERLLYLAGVIDEIGSVDDGSTQTDSLALERQRGITIRSAVVSFVLDDGLTVNLIDTPGHPDFIAEVERVLDVLDGAVLVISAVEGVQAQTRVLMRALQRLGIPTLIFVNKVDRRGAQYHPLIEAISEKLGLSVVAMGTVDALGERDAAFRPFGLADPDFRARAAEVLADHDDSFLAAYLDDETDLSERRLWAELAAQTARSVVHPVFFGSAITGAGADVLTRGLRELLPGAEGDPDAPVSAKVFKIERGSAGDKIAYVRMFSGTIRTRDRLRFGRKEEAKVTAVSVFEGGGSVRRGSVAAGEIGRLWGLSEVRVGDALGGQHRAEEHHFAPPTLETVIVPVRAADKGGLHVALTQLAEQDPLINVRHDDRRQETFVSLYGEVQKEVIQATLADVYGIDVEFRGTVTICIEKPAGAGAAHEILEKGDNPFLATVGLRVERGTLGSGLEFRLEVELGSMPHAFMKAVEDTVRETLRQGLYGWQVVDCVVTMTHSGYLARQSHAAGVFDKSMSSTAGDFRNLTPLVLMSALRQAGTEVYEPVHRFHLEVPADRLGTALPALAKLGAVPEPPRVEGETCTLEGEIPAARVRELQQGLPSMSRGEGVFESSFDSYQPIHGTIPTRPRADRNPLNREEYLLRVAQPDLAAWRTT